MARQTLGFFAASAIEIGGGALDQRHAFLEDLVELLGGLKALSKRDGTQFNFNAGLIGHDTLRHGRLLSLNQYH